MKNLRFLSIGVLASSFMFLTSCQDDETDPIGPSFTQFEENNVGITDGALDATPGQTLRFEWEIRRGDADLQEFTIRMDNDDQNHLVTEEGHGIPYENISSSDNEIYSDAVEITAENDPGTYSYAFIIEDEDGIRETRSVEITVGSGSTDLTAAQSFSWQRQGGNAGTGLDEFGLEWTTNSTTSAIVKKDEATKFVNLGTAAWTNINTVQELDAAIDAAADMNEYTGVSATQNSNPDDVLGVRYNDEVYILHVETGTVTTGTGGTNITITGEYKTEP